MYKYIKWFEELEKKDVAIAGGKGANLGEMRNAGFPIPPGFVVTSNAYFRHLEVNGLKKKIKDILYGLDVNDVDKLNEASERIKMLILGGTFPDDVKEEIISAYRDLANIVGEEPFVAVRSSATAEDLPEASFAGQQKTFLNVKGEGELIQAVKEDWASLFEPRAIFYREENNFDHLKVGLAAVVQKMVNSEVSGVMFSVDPVSEDRNTIVIEAAYGLGEYVVSGTVTPDTYKVDKETLEIKEKYISTQEIMLIRDENGENLSIPVKEEIKKKQKLEDKYIVGLAKIAKQIENHYKFPQDMEWALEKGKLYIVQSRPITTLKEKTSSSVSPEKTSMDESEETESKAEPILRGLPASPGVAVGKVKVVLDIRKDLNKVKQGDILVTKMTTPDAVPAMKKASAIITDEGGMTSHAAIVSRELGIPCIVGTEKATSLLKDGMIVTVDSSKGVVYKGNVAKAHPKEGKEEHAVLVGEALPPTATKVYVNLAQPELADKVSKLPVDGVGLLRAEFIIAEMHKHPMKFVEEGKQQEFIDKLAEKLRIFAAAFHPRPVVYRATDFKSNEYRVLEGGEKYEPHEENPMIGFRGASRYIRQPEVFKMELMAIKKVREDYKLKNLWLMIPFVRRVGELKAIKDLMKEVGLYRTKDFKLWIMVEVPSTVILMDKFVKEGIDGVSIGSNDLTQLTLGIDRDSQILGRDFDERNEAVLRAIKRVVDVCRENGVTVSICGQAPSVYPEFTEKLVEFGVTSVSVNPDAIERVKHIISSAERRTMLDMLRKLSKTKNSENNLFKD